MEVLPTGFHEVGLPRKTPAGTPLKGRYQDTYWFYDLAVELDTSLAAAIDQGNIWLLPKKGFVAEFVGSGGEIDYYITLSTDGHFAEELSAELMRQCSALGVRIGFEIFMAK
jgi:hypothetical protein